jgi:hypothetical protein
MNKKLTKTTFDKIENCLHLTNGETELVITTEFGPRILCYRTNGSKNVFKIFPEQITHIEKDVWKSYGGHRLWHAPEVYPRTYYPDNEKIEWEWNDEVLVLKSPDEKGNNIGKEIRISLAEQGSQVTLEHTLTNTGVWPVKVSAWCLSVMAAGGSVIVPQENYKPHPDCLVPARPLVLWHFTKMNDHRFLWDEKFIQLKEDSNDKTKQKFGVCNTKGWAAYLLDNTVFMKKIPFYPQAQYTDMGCNQEFYTEAGFLEIETLSPYTELAPGESLTHTEKWLLVENKVSQDKIDIDALEELAKTIQ